MRQNGNELGIALWFLVAAFAALMIGRAHAEELRPGTAPAATAPAAAPAAPAAPATVTSPAPAATRAAGLAPAGAPATAASVTAPATASPAGTASRPVAAASAVAPSAAVAAPPVLASMSQPPSSTPDGASAVDAAAKTFRGQVILSDVMIAPASAFTSGDAMVGALQRLKRSTVHGTDGFWRLHMIAFPSPAPAGGTYRLRATDTADGKQRKPIRVFEISAQPGHSEVEMPDLVLTDHMGFKAGHSYEIAVVGSDSGAGKEDVYAQGVITLM